MGQFTTKRGYSIAPDTILKISLPQMLVSEENTLSSFVNGIDRGASGTLSSGFLINLGLGFSLNMIWSCLNVLQLMIKLPLLKILYPATANMFKHPTGGSGFSLLSAYGAKNNTDSEVIQ